MKKLLLIASALTLGIASASYAGGGSTPDPVRGCNPGNDGNRDCPGQDNGKNPPRDSQPVRTPKANQCAESFHVKGVSNSITVEASGVAVSVTDPGFGPSTCNYKLSFLSTSIGRPSQVVSSAIEGSTVWLRFVLNGRPMNMRVDWVNGNAEGSIFELKDFKNPYDIVSSDDFDTDKSQIEISGTQVMVPNTVK